METAAAIAKEAGITIINVNYRFSEWLKGKFFPNGPPIMDLIVNNYNEQEFSDYWLQGVKFTNSREYAFEMNSRWPEIYEHAAERVHKFAGK